MNNLEIISIFSRKLNWWILKEMDENLYLIKLDTLSSFKIAISYELFAFSYFRKRIYSLKLEELKQRFEIVENISSDYEVTIEKGNKLQNKLTLKNNSNNFEIYFVFRDTTLTEKVFNKYYNYKVEIKDKGWP